MVFVCLFKEKEFVWNGRDFWREMPEASFLDIDTFIGVALSLQLTVGQSSGSSLSSQNRSGGKFYNGSSSVPSTKCVYINESSFKGCSLESFPLHI